MHQEDTCHSRKDGQQDPWSKHHNTSQCRAAIDLDSPLLILMMPAL